MSDIKRRINKEDGTKEVVIESDNGIAFGFFIRKDNAICLFVRKGPDNLIEIDFHRGSLKQVRRLINLVLTETMNNINYQLLHIIKALALTAIFILLLRLL